MDETNARQEERLDNLKEASDKLDEFCRNCREQMMNELAEIRTEQRIQKLTEKWEGGWKHRLDGFLGGLIPAVCFLIYWIVKHIK